MNWSKATDASLLFSYVFSSTNDAEWENIAREVGKRGLLEIGKTCLIRVMSNSWNIIEDELEKQKGKGGKKNV